MNLKELIVAKLLIFVIISWINFHYALTSSLIVNETFTLTM